MARAMRRGHPITGAELLDEGWREKKMFSDKITNPMLDDLYNTAKEHGAIGGKVSGAGGGGFMYFICDYENKYTVSKELAKRGAKVTDFMFEPEGVRSWRHRNG